MTGPARHIGGGLLGAGFLLACCLSVPNTALGQNQPQGRLTAETALERCLTKHPKTPRACIAVLEPYCEPPGSARCAQFEIEIWRKLSRGAESKISSNAGASADASFVADASADLRAQQETSCRQRSQNAPSPADAFLQCMKERVIARAIALWSLAQFDSLNGSKE